MGALHHDLAWYNHNNQNVNNEASNWLREGSATTDKDSKQFTSQQAHALSMVANLATADDVEQLIIG